MDVALTGAGGFLAGRSELEARQTRLWGEAAEAFMALPARQRFGFTIWGLRDRDSWIRRNERLASDAPLLFDDQGEPKSAFWAVADAFSRSSG
jgi:endo-1,4-beta-xylanase